MLERDAMDAPLREMLSLDWWTPNRIIVAVLLALFLLHGVRELWNKVNP